MPESTSSPALNDGGVTTLIVSGIETDAETESVTVIVVVYVPTVKVSEIFNTAKPAVLESIDNDGSLGDSVYL